MKQTEKHHRDVISCNKQTALGPEVKKEKSK